LATEDEKNKTIAVVAYPGIALLDLVVTQTVLDRGTKYRTVSVRERTGPIASDTPMAVVPEKRFEEVPHPSVLLVPGERASTFAAMGNEAIRSYVRSAAETAEVAGSICTGALIVASVGLLEGRQATTHWIYYKILEQFGARYVRKRWVEDGKFISSAGIDMALHLAARLTNEKTARRVQRSLAYDPHPPFGAWITTTWAPCPP
jgi:transcriptional regulator GlxA family with amidase domain